MPRKRKVTQAERLRLSSTAALLSILSIIKELQDDDRDSPLQPSELWEGLNLIEKVVRKTKV